LQAFVDDHLLKSGKRCFVVEEDGHVAGIITPHEVKDVDRKKWPELTVAAAMLPLQKLHTVKPATSLREALETMGREDVNQLPVMSNGHLDGIISRGHILRLLQTRAELHV
jgi:CBS domain-containing protein